MSKKLSPKLQAKWDKKLKDNGFVDIEKTVNGKRVLISSPNPYRDSATEDVKEAKAEYYRQMSSKAFIAKYDSEEDLKIIRMHISGTTINFISNLLNLDRQTIRYRIYKYADRWGVRRWKKKPAHTK